MFFADNIALKREMCYNCREQKCPFSQRVLEDNMNEKEIGEIRRHLRRDRSNMTAI